ncbi:MAG: HlyD family efflux transporter periplasmic adaptor subunit [Moraxellaceae bacterium]|jgi:cobalt-zinc-cadmium efflux system membrane fusion protein|nr:HlyD family efflux transporter periplasmic adaptor subunit [Moraxellaceae bacterium]MBP7228996.1 HlyD family efflux transporter periplasmic adaptor subunit [Moraxellaceae bacterium]MBP8852702.1 HlyD family efflux transporter periplasmic adaptor subunit [Moraxellaceae bacterium]MBP9731741.1 HlyD family efflux transporter periplasmic adaptor subunit [Moraxellaceae bacterium]MCC6199219.1 HlyD family efflux transporter periplasmic adaptor subunit [Moraxellaceae bacterium]
MLVRKSYLTLLVLLLTLSGGHNSAYAHGDDDHSQEAKTTAATIVTTDAPQRLADGSLLVPKAVQRRLGLRTIQVRSSTLSASVELNGTVLADPATGGIIQAPFMGAVQPGPKGMPIAGRKVIKGDILVYLRPVSSAIDRGNQQAQRAELDALITIAQQKLTRYEQIANTIPRQDIDTVRIEYAALQKRRNSVAASIDEVLPLRAPASGVLSSTKSILAGQIVDARETLFEVIDPKRLVVEALAYDPAISSILQSASALAGESTVPLQFTGSGYQLREQALPLLFRVLPSATSLAVGQRLNVIVRTSNGIRGIALPRQALVKGNAGELTVWVHTDAERFVVRRIRIQPLDAQSVAVVDGLHESDRVVTEGASLLSQVR